MPVVLVEVGGVARSGHLYDDLTGVAYEYPAGRYESLIWPGQTFVYQKPKVGYTGIGTVGAVRHSPTPGRLICDLHSLEYFTAPVPLKGTDGKYYEADTAFWRDKVYWGQGVRPLSTQRLDAIVARSSQIPSDAAYAHDTTIEYAPNLTRQAVERYSVDVALDHLKGRFPNQPVREMAHSNPGFDVCVGEVNDPLRYVEVKGTQSKSADFFLSEGERQFSMAQQDRYTLIVVSGINLSESTHASLIERDGSIREGAQFLRPHQWRGRLRMTPRVAVDESAPGT